MLWLALAGCVQEEPEPPDTEPLCAEGEVQEGARCLPEACGVGVWGDLPVDSPGAAFVDTNAPAGGDGSREHPFQGLPEADDFDLVLIAEGHYPEIKVVEAYERQRAWLGRCHELVTLDGDLSGDALTWYSLDGTMTVSGMTFQGIVGSHAGLLTVRDSQVMDSRGGVGLHAQNLGTLVFEDGRVEASRPDAENVGGWGVFVDVGGTVILRRTELVDNQSVGVMVLSGGVFEGEDVLVDGLGEGLDVEGALIAQEPGSLLSCTGCTLRNVGGAGALALKGAHLALDDVLIEEVRPLDSAALGVLVDASSASLTGVTVRGLEGYGVVARNASTVEVRGLTLEDVGLDDLDNLGAGIGVFEDSVMSGSDVRIERSVGAGLVLDGGEATLDGLTVLDATGPEGGIGPAIFSLFGELNATAVLIERATGQAVLVQHAGLVEMTGAVHDTVSVDDQAIDIAVLEFSTFRSTDLTLSGGEHGVVLGGDSSMWLQNCHMGPSSGVGVWAQDGGVAVVEDCVVSGRTAIGVGATGRSEFTGAESRLVLEDSVIQGTVRRADLKLATGVAVAGGAHGQLVRSSVGETQGTGVVCEGPSHFAIEQSTVTDSQLAGVFVSNGASLRVEGLQVEGVEQEPSSRLAMGIFVGSSDGQGAAFTGFGVEVSDAGHAGVWVSDGTLVLTESTIAGGPEVELLPDVFAYGHGIYATRTTLTLDETALVHAEGAGLFLHAATAELDAVSFSDNAVDLHVQACEEDWTPPEDASVTWCPDYDEPVLEMTFYGVVDLGGL